MKSSEIAQRYAKALYELSVENKNQDQVFQGLRVLDQAFYHDKTTAEFLANPLVSSLDRLKVLENTLQNKGLNSEVCELVLLLAKKNRLALFHEIVTAFEFQSDLVNQVCRGTVRSATELNADEKSRIEGTVEGVLHKKVILKYVVDPKVIGGLIAQVGSYTFDDSLESHLNRMNEELKRRTV